MRVMVYLSTPMEESPETLVGNSSSELTSMCVARPGLLLADFESAILLPGWRVETEWQVAGSLAAAFLVSLMFEFLRCSRNRLLISRISVGSRRQWPFHLVSAFMYGLQALVGVLLLLLISSGNAWLCAAVVIGLATGCLCFSVTSVSFSFNLNQQQCI